MLEQEIQRHKENQEAAKLVGAVLSNVVGDIALSQHKSLQDEEDARATAAGESPRTITAWGEGSAEKIALHGLVGLIEAKIGDGNAAAGVLGAISQEVMAPMLSDYLVEQGIAAGSEDYKALMQMGATLVGTAVGTLASSDVQGASTGANAAFVGVTNNYLKHDEIQKKQRLTKELAECKTTSCRSEKAEAIQAIDNLNKQRDLALQTACQNPVSTECQIKQTEVRQFAAEIIREGKMGLIMGKDGQHTLIQAIGTVGNGKLLFETGKGVVMSVVDGYRAMYDMLVAVAKDPGAVSDALSEQVRDAVQWVKDNPEKYKEIVEIAEQRLRNGLSGAIEEGNEEKIGLLVGSVLANFAPEPGKKITAVLNVLDEITLAKKAQTLAKRVDVDKVEIIPAGSKGNWSKAANGDLDPNKAHLLDNGHAYITDSSGRVKAVEADLTGIKRDRNEYQQGCAGKSGCADDEGGHLIATALGGAGDRINIVPQDKTLNRGEWKKMEVFLKKEIDAKKTVSMKIDVGYPPGGGGRPNAFLVTATIDGIEKEFPFKQ